MSELDDLINALGSDDWRVEHEATKRLAALRGPEKLARLTAAARGHAGEGSAWRYIDLIADSGDAGAGAALAEIALDHAAHTGPRVCAVSSLSKLDPAALAKVAVALAADPDPEVRSAFAFAAWRLDHAIAVPLLRTALDDAASKVRGAAAFAVGQLRPEGMAQALVSAFEQVEARLRREKSRVEVEDRLREEAELVQALAAYAGKDEIRAAQRIVSRLRELAADNDLDFAEAGFFPASYSRDVLQALKAR